MNRPDNKKVGTYGERLACRYLKRRGYKILARNYSTSIGELDIVAEYKGALVFIEVKMRRSEAYGMPEEAVGAKKRRKLILLARLYIQKKRLYNRSARFDVMSILDRGRFRKKTIKLIKNAFYADG